VIQRLLLGSVATCLIGLETERRQARAASSESAPSPSTSAPGTTGARAAAPAPAIVPPRPLSELTAEYPAGAIGNHDSVVELVVGVDGVPSQVRSLDDVAPFAAAAEGAARSWRFLPAERDGKPVAARIRLSVSFIDPESKAELDSSGAGAAGATLPGAAAASPRTPAALNAAANSRSPAPAVATTEPALPEPLEVTVAARRTTGATRFTRAEVRELPGAFGDAFRAIEAMPGVTPIASGLPYFFVRGAPPGNLGYFIDGLSIPTLYHVAVGPSVIHPAFIESVDLYSGAYPARYGRFAGAVIAGTSRAPSYELRGEASVRLVDSGAFLEVPFADQRGSVMLAGRYSYTAALVSLLVPEIEVGYWDYQARVRYKLSDDDTLTLFGFGAHDFLSAEDEGVAETVYDVTFHRLDLNWQRTLSAASALQIGASLGWDQTGSGADDTLALRSQRIGTRVSYTRQVSGGVQLRAGADLELSRFDVDISEGPDDDDDDDDDDDASSPERQELPFAALPVPEIEQLPITRESFTELFASRDDLLGGAWLDWVLELGRGVTLTPGFRFDFYRSGSSLKLAPEPRVSARFQLNERLALIHDIGIAHQAPSFAIPVPGFSGTAEKGLQRGVQTSAGAHFQITETTRAQLTLFQTALFAGSDPIGLFQLDNSDISVDAATARVTGHTYGAELYLRRDLTRRFGGFISYTLSRSTRTTARLEGPSSADRTHVLNLAAAYRLGQSWRLGGRFVFYSGIPAEVAYPQAAQAPPRGPLFLRLDWRLEKRWRLGSTGFWALVLEVQNTTLAKETLDVSCYAYGCESESIGPVTLPSLGLEASF
jgi:TonB-dependent receptor-like protein/TonB-like protein